MNPLATLIIDFRRKRGISQAELARALDVPRSTLWRWETGRSLPSYAKLERMTAYMSDYDKQDL